MNYSNKSYYNFNPTNHLGPIFLYVLSKYPGADPAWGQGSPTPKNSIGTSMSPLRNFSHRWRAREKKRGEWRRGSENRRKDEKNQHPLILNPGSAPINIHTISKNASYISLLQLLCFFFHAWLVLVPLKSEGRHNNFLFSQVQTGTQACICCPTEPGQAPKLAGRWVCH